MKTKNNILLSVILTAHHEGVLLHKTIKCIQEAFREACLQTEECEIILHLDNPDNKTKSYVDRECNKIGNIHIYSNIFKDVGMSRNFAITKSSGKYIAIVDGDDLFSFNWFKKAISILEDQKESVIVHPEANYTFGILEKQHVLWVQHNSFDIEKDRLLLAGVNRWASMCVAKKEIFINHPYPKTEKGFGHEDYYFNISTVSDRIQHIVAPETIQFYRRKNDSVLLMNNNNANVQRYSSLFDIKATQKISPKDALLDTRRNKPFLRTAYDRIRASKINNIIIPPAKIIKKIIRKPEPIFQKKKIPSYVISWAKQVSKIETQLYPTQEEKRKIVFYNSDDKYSIGVAYCNAVKNVTELPSYIFIVPWLVSGGADKVVLNYIKAFNKQKPNASIAIVTTEPTKNTWEDKLPPNSYIIDFGNSSTKLSNQDKDYLFSKILVQLKCKKIHIINSKFGYLWTMKHKELVRHNFELNVSLFNYEYIPGTNKEGRFDYADPFLTEIDDVVSKVYTDNNKVISRTIERNGLDLNKFIVHYQPNDLNIKKPKRKIHKGKVRILWASRITSQKIPEVLCRIGKELDKNKYSIDVYGRFDEGYDKKMFDGIPTISYKGSYNGFNSINANNYDLFLYTSSGDGLPNVLLEVTAAGLPIVAADVGGVSEFIKDEETGFLVDDIYDQKQYIRRIEEIINNYSQAAHFATNAQELIKNRHSKEVFFETVNNDIKI